MAACGFIKGNGERCRGIAKAGSDWCPAHDPERREARKRAASRAAKAKGARGGGELAGLRSELATLHGDVRAGRVPPNVAGALVQVLNCRVRVEELEHRIELDKRTAMSAREAEALVEALQGAVRRHVRDPRILDEIGREIAEAAGDLYA